MATSLSLENDSSLAQGYIKVNGTTAATLTTSGITGNLTGNADTATKFSTTTGSAPAYACRAWVNFDGTRDTTGAVSTANTNRFIRSSGNVTSVLRNAAGDYTVNFATAMSDANYSSVITGRKNLDGLSANFPSFYNTAFNTGNVRVASTIIGNNGSDSDTMSVAIFGN
jgi:hypothetical protein